MLISMKMMKENPQMMATAQKLMANMTPEEMLEQSKVAQEKMAGMTKAQLEEAAEVSSVATLLVLFTGRSAAINDLFTPVFVDGKETNGKHQPRCSRRSNQGNEAGIGNKAYARWSCCW